MGHEEIGLEDWINFKLNRFYDYGIRLCDRKAVDFQARAETAMANGKQRSAARYLRRAERERKYSRWSRNITQRDPDPV
ncbi:hypothetical protein [Candidatus Poriferisodalis sp.]|uniref:hypothetical protein n=1 Tax=Candidatus Poriferisodalis sp. TaxID=3101277 RepID=UPI003B025B6B